MKKAHLCLSAMIILTITSCMTPEVDLFRIVDRGRIGYMDNKGTVVIQPIFAVAGEFFEGLAPASKDGKLFGYIDTKGQFVIPEQFSRAGSFSEGLAPAIQGEKMGIIDRKGQWILQPQWSSVSFYDTDYELAAKDGFIMISQPTDHSPTPLFAMVDKSGKVIREPHFDHAAPFSEGLALVVNGGKAGYINTKGEMVIPQAYPLAQSFSEGLALVGESPVSLFYIDKTGRKVLDFTGDRAQLPDGSIMKNFSPFHEGQAVVKVTAKDGLSLYGMINKEGKWVIPGIYTALRSLSEGLAVVQKDSKMGYLNGKGEMVIEPRFDDARNFHKGLAEVIEGNKHLYINKKGEVVRQLDQPLTGQEAKP